MCYFCFNYGFVFIWGDSLRQSPYIETGPLSFYLLYYCVERGKSWINENSDTFDLRCVKNVLETPFLYRDNIVNYF